MDISVKVARYVSKPEFQRWQDNPEEPRDWTGVAKFLDLYRDDESVKPYERLEEIRAAVRTAMDWCREQNIDYIICGRNFANPIRVSDMTGMLDFLVALTYRFPEMLERGY